MGHTPYDYRIEGGRAVIDEEAAEQVRLIYKFYLESDSLITATNKAGIKSFHTCQAEKKYDDPFLQAEYTYSLIESEG